jgi:hypothetical protein
MRWLPLLVVSLAGVAVGGSAAAPPLTTDARPVRIVGVVEGAPSGARVTIRAIEAQTMEIVASSRAAPSGSFRVSAPPGVYAVAATAVTRAASVSARSALGAGRPGATLRLDVDVRARKPASTRAPLAAARSEEAAGTIIGVSPDTVLPLPGYPQGLPIDDLLITELTAADAGCRDARGRDTLQVVEIRHRQAILRELALQRTKLVDPSTRVGGGHLLQPRYMVRGGGTRTASGRLTYSIRVVDLKTGRTTATVQGAGTDASFLADVARLGRELREKLCSHLFSFEGLKLHFDAVEAGVSVDYVLAGRVCAADPYARPWRIHVTGRWVIPSGTKPIDTVADVRFVRGKPSTNGSPAQGAQSSLELVDGRTVRLTWSWAGPGFVPQSATASVPVTEQATCA